MANLSQRAKTLSQKALKTSWFPNSKVHELPVGWHSKDPKFKFIEGIAKVCHERGKPLIVDEAWGAPTFPFMTTSDLGHEC